ncbi:roadblock/LC7 domain-containing protein [Streptacidiphilus jiangxiensis]|uniref:Roadblock/LC7 domain-containing protein n=1 Tax=Streptacidiphilus jiangxiensis TaxID=235985 RepID=A0A1H8BP34_STRJI|nr:roadblock/LC7 domain-containing protein [Streptacidiphilus jiangxiensis]SEM84563.1 Roadblock/LC7 domain-containing protein [Streptacidiphilus jiangxiensis]
MDANSFTPEALGLLLANFVGLTNGVEDAVFASLDGLPLASTEADEEKRGHWAALTTSIFHTANRLGPLRGIDEPGRQVIVELGDDSLVMIMSAGEGLPPWHITAGTANVTGCVLGVATSSSADHGVVAFAAQQFVQSISQHLIVPARAKS